MTKQKKTLITLPIGTAKYPWLNKPDTAYNKNGVYKVDLVVDPNDPQVQAVLGQLQDELEAFYQNEKGGKGELADILIEKDGEFFFRVKQSAFEYKGEVILPEPTFYDASGKRILKKPQVFGGSRIAVSAEVWPYSKQEKYREGGKMMTVTVSGLTLKLKAVQIIELSQGSGGGDNRSAESYGFGAHEGGYSYDEDADGFNDQEGNEPLEEEGDF
ncbi:hypothetical protein [Vibrio sp. SCSIO 43137]|uniref:hypothetical protein n=1 Tax=Vibrio sp. SCSIO 43137 TaxID=3021011 RepID=UPI002307EB02|nr:hypothetical protein [Vibrio sp. SCSIO 43137]WCE28442.1 hypothetical protein PK654_08640 [Vibrio sp. SCSIO 43137]